jgi:hypothetical protein
MSKLQLVMLAYIVGANSGLCIAVAITGVSKGSIGLVIYEEIL